MSGGWAATIYAFPSWVAFFKRKERWNDSSKRDWETNSYCQFFQKWNILSKGERQSLTLDDKVDGFEKKSLK